MTLTSKISRLSRIPQLLNKRREAEEEEKRKRDDSSERPPFPFNGQPNFNRPKPSSRSRAESVSQQTAKSIKEGIGRRIDVFV